jgi:hypothetical protein
MSALIVTAPAVLDVMPLPKIVSVFVPAPPELMMYGVVFVNERPRADWLPSSVRVPAPVFENVASTVLVGKPADQFAAVFQLKSEPLLFQLVWAWSNPGVSQNAATRERIREQEEKRIVALGRKGL